MKHQQPEQEKHKLFDDLDVQKLAKAVAEFKRERRGRRLQSPFMMYCNDAKMIRFDEYGNIIVRNAGAYHAVIQIWAEVEKKAAARAYAEYKETERLAQLSPQSEQSA